jgi:SAM-dependent methyltransferase
VNVDDLTTAGRQEARTSFDGVYDLPDPRMFFRAFEAFDYQTPLHAQGVFRQLIAACGRPVTVLDICCSYGINAALLNHDLTLVDLYDHYTSPHATALGTEELIEHDKAFFAARRRADAVRVIGLDVAPNAIDYARAVGLLDDGFVQDLETGPPSEDLLRATRHTTMITVTGGVSFLSARTLRPLLSNAHEPLWVAAFVLRTGSYRLISDELASFGLVTEKLTSRTFRQRRFTDELERRYAVAAVAEVGDDPDGVETDGYFHTALHLSRPSRDADSIPLDMLVADL